jgi:glucokinase
MILPGDIGGTHTRFAGLEEIVAVFLAEHPADLDCACFDVAGPVRNGRVKTTNLPWIVDTRAARIAVREPLHIHRTEPSR